MGINCSMQNTSESANAVGDALVGDWAHVLAYHFVALSHLVVPVKPALGFLPTKRTALMKGLIKLGVESAVQQLGKHCLRGKVDLLHEASNRVVLQFSNVGQPGLLKQVVLHL
jgi:hypothetical protein